MYNRVYFECILWFWQNLLLAPTQYTTAQTHKKYFIILCLGSYTIEYIKWSLFGIVHQWRVKYFGDSERPHLEAPYSTSKAGKHGAVSDFYLKKSSKFEKKIFGGLWAQGSETAASNDSRLTRHCRTNWFSGDKLFFRIVPYIFNICTNQAEKRKIK